MKNSNDTIGNRSRDLPVFSAVPQPLRHRVPRSFTMLSYLSTRTHLIRIGLFRFPLDRVRLAEGVVGLHIFHEISQIRITF
jgi:hypothetical protein